MSRFRYSDEEMDLNKILKMNQGVSESLLNDLEVSSTRVEADMTIDASMELLRSIGKGASVEKLSSEINVKGKDRKLEHRPVMEEWDEIVKRANEYAPTTVVLEDVMTES